MQLTRAPPGPWSDSKRMRGLVGTACMTHHDWYFLVMSCFEMTKLGYICRGYHIPVRSIVSKIVAVSEISDVLSEFCFLLATGDIFFFNFV